MKRRTYQTAAWIAGGVIFLAVPKWVLGVALAGFLAWRFHPKTRAARKAKKSAPPVVIPPRDSAS